VDAIQRHKNRCETGVGASLFTGFRVLHETSRFTERVEIFDFRQRWARSV